jgi:hypothetical protein
MDTESAAAQRHMTALAAQYLLCRLSNNPRQFMEPPLAAFCRAPSQQSRREIDPMAVPF